MAGIHHENNALVSAFIKSAEMKCHNPLNQMLLPEELPTLEDRTKQLLDAYPDNLHIHEYYSVCLIRQNKIDEVKNHWQPILKDNPADKDINISYAYVLLIAFQAGLVADKTVIKQTEAAFRLDLNNDEKEQLIMVNSQVSEFNPRNRKFKLPSLNINNLDQ